MPKKTQFKVKVSNCGTDNAYFSFPIIKGDNAVKVLREATISACQGLLRGVSPDLSGVPRLEYALALAILNDLEFKDMTAAEAVVQDLSKVDEICAGFDLVDKDPK